MRKIAVALASVLLIFGVFSEIIVPLVLNRTARSRLIDITKAPDIDVSMKATPGLKMLFGQVDHVEITSPESMIGDVRANNLVLVGDRVSINMNQLLSGGGFEMVSADRIDFSGFVTEAALKELIEKKVEKVEEVAIAINPDFVQVNGTATLIGHKVKISMEGNLVQDANRILLHLNQLHVDKTRLGRGFVNSLFGDIELVDFSRLKIPVHLTGVQQRNKEVLLTFSN